MNYIKHLTGFFEKVATDKTLNPTHISLYIALFQFWNCNRFKNPISISRDEIMQISKISSKATYHKCLKNLHALGYIKYEPSFNPFRGSHVYLFNFANNLIPIPESDKTTRPKNEPISRLGTVQVADKSYTTKKTSTEQALVSFINNTNKPNNSNNLNGVNVGKQAKKIEEDIFILKKLEKLEKKMPEPELDKRTESASPAFADYNAEHTKTSRQKSSKKKEKDITNDCVIPSAVEVSHLKNEKPTIENVKSYFQENNFPELEAQKFFNYFSSVGWLVGGKTPMVNWQAAAQNWILNSINFNQNTDTNPPNQSKKLNATTEKNYAEPL